MAHKTISILGSTGSVGKATIDVASSQPDMFTVQALTANTNVAMLAEQAKATRAKLAVIGEDALYGALKDALAGTGIEAAAGRKAVIDAAGMDVDYTMAAIVGMAGLEPILAAIANGKSVAIANKEPLVAAGDLVMNAAKKSGATLLPVDSEHNAVFQLFEPESMERIRRIILTASGGPFREWTKEQMYAATPEQAVAHPNWSMGAKISVDSATMMNKALEVIEAHFLFNLPLEQIDVMVHPQSIVHAMVEYTDGSVLAHMGASDMRVPITHTLGWPGRIDGPAQRLDLKKLSSLTFESVDDCRFPAINYAYRVLREGASACIAFNAANEMAVSAFLGGKIGYFDIFDIVRRTVEENQLPAAGSLEAILGLDDKMRSFAQTCILDCTKSTNRNPNRKVS